ncbi:MAG: hypothetical protein AAGC46_11655 [Solirubrobacteraceae bacterium]|nr:hypothetical protein [Patulibacter sp.]
MSSTDSLVVRPVSSKQDLKQFIALPYRLHGSSQLWVPPLRLERKIFLSKKQNPFFTHGEAEYFIAERAGKVVGRITAQIDRNFNEYHGNDWGMFGFLEFEDDAEILRALLDAAAAWLKPKGRDRMVGPMDFQMNNESGVLIEGFDIAPMLAQPWHPRYYQQRVEEAGLTKAMDLNMWALEIDDRDKVHPAIFAAAETARTEHGLRLEKITRRSLKKDISEDFRRLFNAAWSRNWGFTPYSDADIKGLVEEFHLVFDSRWMMKAVDQNDHVVGMALTFPDIHQVLRKMNGTVAPWTLHHYLFGRRKIDRIRVGFLGVEPESQHTGAAALLYEEHFRVAHETPVRTGEMGWILETNKAMNWAMQGMNGKLVKKYRVYEQVLAEGAEPLPAPIPWDAA